MGSSFSSHQPANTTITKMTELFKWLKWEYKKESALRQLCETLARRRRSICWWPTTTRRMRRKGTAARYALLRDVWAEADEKEALDFQGSGLLLGPPIRQIGSAQHQQLLFERVRHQNDRQYTLALALALDPNAWRTPTQSSEQAAVTTGATRGNCCRLLGGGLVSAPRP